MVKDQSLSPKVRHVEFGAWGTANLAEAVWTRVGNKKGEGEEIHLGYNTNGGLDIQINNPGGQEVVDFYMGPGIRGAYRSTSPINSHFEGKSQSDDGLSAYTIKSDSRSASNFSIYGILGTRVPLGKFIRAGGYLTLGAKTFFTEQLITLSENHPEDRKKIVVANNFKQRPLEFGIGFACDFDLLGPFRRRRGQITKRATELGVRVYLETTYIGPTHREEPKLANQTDQNQFDLLESKNFSTFETTGKPPLPEETTVKGGVSLVASF